MITNNLATLFDPENLLAILVNNCSEIQVSKIQKATYMDSKDGR